MTFLPIVDRELRVAARRGGTYSMRLRVALLALIVGSSIMAANFGAPPATVGNYIFIGLAVLAFVSCLLSGRNSTADCLSEEKREGTLGLLFLTDLKGYDVVLGKMVATSVNAFYGMLAIFPVLAVPMLMGGVSNGEFWRTVLVLVNTFLFSLAIGIFSSALSRDARKALALNFAALIFFTLVLPFGLNALRFALAGPEPIPELLLSSPICSFYFALDNGYKMKPELFWWSVVVIHGFTWLLVIQACRIVPRSWQDQPPAARRAAKSRGQGFWHFWSYGPPAKRPAFRKSLLDVNAFYWLAARARLKPLHVWVFFALIGCWWIWGRASSGVLWVDESTNVVMALLLNTTLKLWVALEAGQRLAEDKKIGALELLLSTPLTVRDILRGQLLALRRQFLGPVIFAIVLELFLMEASVREGVHYNPEIRVLWLAGIIMLVADLATLSLVAMTQALRQKTHNQAILRTVLLILVLPWLGLSLQAVIGNLWSMLANAAPWSPDWRAELPVWFGLGMMTDFIFLWRAQWQLQTQMREYAMQRPEPLLRSGGWFNRRRNRPAPPPSIPASNPSPASKVLTKN